jgi:transposase
MRKPKQRKPHNDLSRSLTPLNPNHTLIAVIELSQKSWLVAGIIPGVERQPLKKLEPGEDALLSLIERWRKEAKKAGYKVERIAVAFLASLVGAITHVVGNEAVGIDDGGPALALADVAPEREGLPESHPALRGVAPVDDGVPQDEDVDAAVGPAAGSIPGQSKRRAHARRAPRLDPRQSASLQLGYDLVGDLLVEPGLLVSFDERIADLTVNVASLGFDLADASVASVETVVDAKERQGRVPILASSRAIVYLDLQKLAPIVPANSQFNMLPFEYTYCWVPQSTDGRRSRSLLLWPARALDCVHIIWYTQACNRRTEE